MIIPVGPEGGNQELVQYDKQADGSIKKQVLMGVIYVPLTDKNRQWRGTDILIQHFFELEGFVGDRLL